MQKALAQRAARRREILGVARLSPGTHPTRWTTAKNFFSFVRYDSHAGRVRNIVALEHGFSRVASNSHRYFVRHVCAD